MTVVSCCVELAFYTQLFNYSDVFLRVYDKKNAPIQMTEAFLVCLFSEDYSHSILIVKI